MLGGKPHRPLCFDASLPRVIATRCRRVHHLLRLAAQHVRVQPVVPIVAKRFPPGHLRAIQHMIATMVWHPGGTPMSAQEFREALLGKLPEFFSREEELRRLWSVPDTRSKLLHGLAESGLGHELLAEMQKLISAEKSDLFDVLAYVAYTRAPVTREERVAQAQPAITTPLQLQAAGIPRFRARAVRADRG